MPAASLAWLLERLAAADVRGGDGEAAAELLAEVQPCARALLDDMVREKEAASQQAELFHMRAEDVAAAALRRAEVAEDGQAGSRAAEEPPAGAAGDDKDAAASMAGPLELGVLLSNPVVVALPGSKALQAVDKLDHDAEMKLLLRTAGEAERAFRVQTACATTDELRSMLDRGCTGLHFSGHGVEGHGVEYLLFEDAVGGGHLVDGDALHRLLRSGGGCGGLRFIFMASCHSSRMARVFISAGVPFVICVRREEAVMDRASITFVRAFYHALLSGRTVPAAFEVGQARVSAEAGIPLGESDKFLLLSRHALRSGEAEGKAAEAADSPDAAAAAAAAAAAVAPYAALPPGALLDLSRYPRYRHLPAQEEVFIGRQPQMHYVLTLLSKQRLVTIRGPPGIGKTTLAREVAHHIAGRRHFAADGVLYVSLVGATSAERMMAAMLMAVEASEEELGAALGLSAPVASFGGSGSSSFASASDAGSDGGSFARSAGASVTDVVTTMSSVYRQLRRVLRNREVVVVMDNMEDPLHADSSGVRRCILMLLQAFSSMRLLVTSRQSFGGGMPGVSEKVLTLHQLPPRMAAMLFHRRSPRPLTAEELFPEGGVHGWEETVAALANHSVLRFLSGHPQAIALAASLLQDRTLDEVRHLLTSRGVKELAVPDLMDSERSAVNTLVISLDASLEHLRRRQPQAVTLFALLGILPGGALGSDLQDIWGDGWRDLADMLVRNCLIERRQVADSSVARFMAACAARDSRAAERRARKEQRRVKRRRKLRKAAEEDSAPRVRLFAGSDDEATMYDSDSDSSDSGFDSDGGRGEADDDAAAALVGAEDHFSTFPFITAFAEQLLQEEPAAWARFSRAVAVRMARVVRWASTYMGLMDAKSECAFTLLELHEVNIWRSLLRSTADVAAVPHPCLARVACEFARTLYLTHRYQDGLRVLYSVLRHVQASGDKLSEAHVHHSIGNMCVQLKDYDRAKKEYGIALLLYRAVHVQAGRAIALNALGYVHSRLGNLFGANKCFLQSLEHFRACGHLFGQLTCHHWLATLQPKLRTGHDAARESSRRHFQAKRDLHELLEQPYPVRGVGDTLSLHLELPTKSERDSSPRRRRRTEAAATSPPTTVAATTTLAATAPLSTSSTAASGKQGEGDGAGERTPPRSALQRRRQYGRSLRKRRKRPVPPKVDTTPPKPRLEAKRSGERHAEDKGDSTPTTSRRRSRSLFSSPKTKLFGKPPTPPRRPSSPSPPRQSSKLGRARSSSSAEKEAASAAAAADGAPAASPSLHRRRSDSSRSRLPVKRRQGMQRLPPRSPSRRTAEDEKKKKRSDEHWRSRSVTRTLTLLLQGFAPDRTMERNATRFMPRALRNLCHVVARRCKVPPPLDSEERVADAVGDFIRDVSRVHTDEQVEVVLRSKLDMFVALLQADCADRRAARDGTVGGGGSGSSGRSSSSAGQKKSTAARRVRMARADSSDGNGRPASDAHAGTTAAVVEGSDVDDETDDVDEEETGKGVEVATEEDEDADDEEEDEEDEGEDEMEDEEEEEEEEDRVLRVLPVASGDVTDGDVQRMKSRRSLRRPARSAAEGVGGTDVRSLPSRIPVRA
eukprot:PLAT175.5.p1 GENE.PLAT175.5~~PLAT175.5.p1  ORF type:complete len:1597 (+),score=689.47 PLAT175.5:1104-5894(+)